LCELRRVFSDQIDTTDGQIIIMKSDMEKAQNLSNINPLTPTVAICVQIHV